MQMLGTLESKRAPSMPCAFSGSYACPRDVSADTLAQMLKSQRVGLACASGLAQGLLTPVMTQQCPTSMIEQDSAFHEFLTSEYLQIQMRLAALSQRQMLPVAQEMPSREKLSFEQTALSGFDGADDFPKSRAQLIAESIIAMCAASGLPCHLLFVRRVTRLGSETVEKLSSYLSYYGHVCGVHLIPASPSRRHRVRHSGLVLVRMDSATAVDRIIAAGEDHDIDGVTVLMSHFDASKMDSIPSGTALMPGMSFSL